MGLRLVSDDAYDQARFGIVDHYIAFTHRKPWIGKNGSRIERHNRIQAAHPGEAVLHDQQRPVACPQTGVPQDGRRCLDTSSEIGIAEDIRPCIDHRQVWCFPDPHMQYID